MNLLINITPKANQDLDDLFEFMAQNNPDIALRFFDAARETIARLALMPNIGNKYFTNNPHLKGLRKWGIKGFNNYLIFYLASENELTIVRIIHASRDFNSILEQE